MLIKFGRDICCELNTVEMREWLVTNGIGGYASGTVAGLLTRRYHGLLVAALKPPLGRNLLVTKFDETASYDGKTYPLMSNRWADGGVDPNGYINIQEFRLDGTVPVWTFACGDALLEKTVWMEQGANTTYIRYKLLRGSMPLDIGIKAYVNYRDYHGSTHAGGWRMDVEAVNNGIRVLAYDGAVPYYVQADSASVQIFNEWCYKYYLSLEQYRGLDAIEDHLHAATLSRRLEEGEVLTVVASTEPQNEINWDKSLSARKNYEEELINRFINKNRQLMRHDCPSVNHLALSADQFIVSRALPGINDGKSVIAGYHWFGDWGRDTMISLPGLAICTGRPEIARLILKTFAGYVDQGMLPNRFPDAGEAPEYNTVDATLWYFEAVRAYFEDTRDTDFLTEIFPVLDRIIDWHLKGTRYNIKADPKDGLLYAGQPGVQLTWMDAKVGDWVVTPRIGKPVEVNALWYNALRTMSVFAKALNKPSAKYDAPAELALKGFSRFWNNDLGYCFDVIDGPGGNDPSLRPNQIFAVSLRESPLSPEQQKMVLDVCARKLLTSYGLRSLSPDHPDYKGRYGGDQRSRDGAYHQGTVWGWLIGHFTTAHLKVYGDPETARRFLSPLLEQIKSHGVGSMSEIFDGDAPFGPRGCIAQAWTVAEVIRAFTEIERAGSGV